MYTLLKWISYWPEMDDIMTLIMLFHYMLILNNFMMKLDMIILLYADTFSLYTATYHGTIFIQFC